MALRDHSAQEMKDALEQAGGVIAAAARIVGCSRTTMYKAIDEYVTVKDAYERANETNKDDAEETLLDFVRGEIEDIDPATQLRALKFYLATKAKDRGYTKREEHTGKDGDPMQTRNVNANMDLKDFDQTDDPEELMHLFNETFGS